MKILVDTNVILDVALKRQDFVADSFAVYKMVEEGKVDGLTIVQCLLEVL